MPNSRHPNFLKAFREHAIAAHTLNVNNVHQPHQPAEPQPLQAHPASKVKKRSKTQDSAQIALEKEKLNSPRLTFTSKSAPKATEIVTNKNSNSNNSSNNAKNVFTIRKKPNETALRPKSAHITDFTRANSSSTNTHVEKRNQQKTNESRTQVPESVSTISCRRTLIFRCLFT
jgi:hypothetical protein